MSAGPYDAWVGRTERTRDVLTPGPLRGLAALFNRDPETWTQGQAPPLAHWLYFLPSARQSDLAADGHPKRGGFLPPIEAPRRMWAGGRLEFHEPLRIDAVLQRVSTIAGIASKTGAGSEMTFVTLRHEIFADDRLAVTEEQDIVYRQAGAAIAQGAAASREAEREQAIAPDEPMLFRFSALTFNAHRIHYDKAYAAGVEGYPNLVVQGPLIAMWLMHHWLAGGGPPVSFAFRARAPLFCGDTAKICAADRDLWCLDGAGRVVMSGEVA